MAPGEGSGGRRRKGRGPAAGTERSLPTLEEDITWPPILPIPEDEEPEATEAPPPEEDYRERYRGLLADFENYRRRTRRETDAAVEAAKGRILLKVVDLHDGIEHVLAGLPEDARGLRDGLSLVVRNLETLLREESVVPVAVKGEVFRPEEHEAVGRVPPTEALEAGRVAELVQQGYRAPSGLLRPAKVLVSGKDEE